MYLIFKNNAKIFEYNKYLFLQNILYQDQLEDDEGASTGTAASNIYEIDSEGENRRTEREAEIEETGSKETETEETETEDTESEETTTIDHSENDQMFGATSALEEAHADEEV